MAGNALLGPLLAQALAGELGDPQPGAIAYVRCLTPDVVEQLAADAGFEPEGWAVWRVADSERDDLRTLTADRAVELREGKGDAMVLLVDTGRAGAGMDGIYSAGREVNEAGLFRAALSLAAAAITKRQSAVVRRYAEDALRAARRVAGGRDAVSPWTAFDYLCRVAVGEQPPGASLNLIGLWPIRGGGEGFDHKAALNDSRRFVDRLLGPAAASLAPAARIESLRMDQKSRQRHTQLARFLHAADAKQHLHDALNELAEQEELWVGSLRTEGPAQSIKEIVLTPWRNRSGKVHHWSGLTDDDDAEGPPVLNLGTDQDRQRATLEVRWKADPGDIERSAVDYRVVIRTSLDEELAVQDVPHSARKGGEKCRFSRDDFASLPDDAVQPAKVVVAVIGEDDNERIEPQESEEFEIRFGDPPEPGHGGVSKVERTFSEGLAGLRGRDAVAEIATSPSLAAGSGSVGYVTLRTPVEQGRRRSFRVLRPSLVAEVEEDWANHNGRIGRWTVKVRSSGERAELAQFLPMAGSGPAWERAVTASRKIAEWFAKTYGGVAQVYDECGKPFDLIRGYLRAWSALLEGGDPTHALAQTVEVQSLSGSPIGLIVLPAHPLRVAWHAAYDNLVLHAAFEQGETASNIRKELKGLDGAMFPAFLPNPHGGAFVFADTLGFHAAGMVPDLDREPKAAVALLARAFGDNTGDAAPTVGGQSAAVLGSEIVKYLSCHDTARLLRVHTLRAGDGMTVARALGEVLRHYVSSDDEAEDADTLPPAPVFSLELYPSEDQRGVTGRFIADAREKRRSGAGVLAEADRWMLESLSLPGGVNLPRLRWARKDQQDPKKAAHLAVAFDTFESRVIAGHSPAAPVSRAWHAFGLLSFYERQYASGPAPQWTSSAGPASKGEKHPSGRSHTDTLTRLQEALHRTVAHHLGAESGVPVLRTEISDDKAENLKALHRLCDWVVTLDRNAGIEYFDSPRDHQEIYDAYVIDCVPDREDLGCLQMITSTANLAEVRSLLDRALDQMGLSRSLRNAEFLMERLKALSGRLAIRLTGHRPATSELIALAVAHAHCTTAAPDDVCWLPLRDGFIVPADDVRDLLPPLSAAEDEDDAGEPVSRVRPDLIHVSTTPRSGLRLRFIEVKYRRHLRTARAPEMLDEIRRQTDGLRSRWEKWYDHENVCATFRAIRRAKLARVLRFYADKAHRHGLPAERHAALVAEIDRMIERGGNYAFATNADDRGWVFCPDYGGERPLLISPNEWETKIYLFGPGLLPDSDFRFEPAPAEPSANHPISLTPEVQPSPDTSASLDTTNVSADAEQTTPSVCLGTDARTNAAVDWSLEVQGNPHLLIAGLPGMGKTTCLLNLCRQLVAAQVRPIVFSYHQDIDERLAETVESVRFIDFDGLGFHPLQVVDRTARVPHLDIAADLRDIFTAIYPELGDLQGERIRTAVKDSFVEAGWGPAGAPADAAAPDFVRFVEILRATPKPDRGLSTLLARLNELDDYGFFHVRESHRSLWDHDQPTVIRIHTTQNENLQRAFASLVFYGLYKEMFRRGTQERITHALVFDEAHRAARLRLIPTMAKECRKYGISLVLASQEARDFNVSVFSAIANYLVLRLTETDARFLVRNVSNSQQERALIDRIKQMERFKGLFFTESRSQPSTVNLTS